ncbi:MAG: TonB-dependent receptor [Steroidobacteraceae bacterium]
MIRNARLLRHCVSSALLWMAVEPCVLAQTSSGLEEITVTARRRVENLQTTPVAVTVFNEEELTQRGINTVYGLASSTPNLGVFSTVGNPSAVVLNLRGQFQSDNLITLDPSVGVYLDDVYLARSYGIALDMVDIADVEVLKGPQGTLYGRNTTGGAIRMTSRKADPSAGLGGNFRVGYGDYDAILVQGAVNLPVSDSLAFRYAGSFNQHDGYVKQVIVNQDATLTPTDTNHQNDRDSQYHRLSVTWEAADDVSVWLTGDWYRNNTNGGALVNRGGDVMGGSFATLLTATESACRQDDFYCYVSDIKGTAESEGWGVAGTAEWRISDTLTSKIITSYRKNDSDQHFNTDGGASPNGLFVLYFDTTQPQSAHQFSTELQLLGEAFDKKLDWLLGAYYFEESGDDETGGLGNFRFVPQLGRVARFARTFIADADNKSISLFAHGAYHFTDQLSVSAGLRATRDTKEMSAHNTLATTPDGPEVCVYPVGLPDVVNNGTECTFSPSDDFSFISWQASIDYQFTDSMFTYLKAANSSRSGGQQLRGQNAATIVPFDEETATDIELGFKADLLSGRLRTNLAYFHTFYTDTQQTTIPPSGGTTYVANLGDAEIDGVELEVSALPVDQLTLHATVGYVDVKYDDDNVIAQRTPDWNASASAVFEHAAGPGNMAYRVDYSYRDKLAVSTDRTFVRSSPYGYVPSVNLVNARISYTFDKYEIAAWGKNLADKEYYTGGINIAGLMQPWIIGDPRTYGVEFAMNFE